MFHPPHPISFPRQNMCARLVGMHVMESEFPIKLARRMQEQVIEDKVWSLSVNRSRKADYMLQHILVSVPSHNKTGSTKDALQPGTETPLSLLTDELVTGICVPLLLERQIQPLGPTYENDDNINNIHNNVTLVTWTRIALLCNLLDETKANMDHRNQR